MQGAGEESENFEEKERKRVWERRGRQEELFKEKAGAGFERGGKNRKSKLPGQKTGETGVRLGLRCRKRGSSDARSENVGTA